MNSSRVKLQHRPFLTPIWLTVGAAAAAFVFALFVIWIWGTANSTTVIVIRPAEADADQADAKLSAAGAQRARLLAHMFGAAAGPGRLDAIYVSDTALSKLTAAPLADRLHLALSADAGKAGKALAHRALDEHAGGRVLIVANLDSIPGVVAALSGIDAIPTPDGADYGLIYVVTVPRIGHANLLRLNY